MPNPPDKCPVCGAAMLEEYDDEVFGHMILFSCSTTDDGYEYASNVKTGVYNHCPNAHRIALENIPYRRMWKRLKGALKNRIKFKSISEESKSALTMVKAWMTKIEQEEGDG